jgi:hypothetical protein
MARCVSVLHLYIHCRSCLYMCNKNAMLRSCSYIIYQMMSILVGYLLVCFPTSSRQKVYQGINSTTLTLTTEIFIFRPCLSFTIWCYRQRSIRQMVQNNEKGRKWHFYCGHLCTEQLFTRLTTFDTMYHSPRLHFEKGIHNTWPTH